MDAASAETYKRLRGGQLLILERNIEAFLNRRAQLNLKTPLLRLSFIVLPENRAEMEEFRNKWFDLVDYIDFQNYVDLSQVDVLADITTGPDEKLFQAMVFLGDSFSTSAHQEGG